MVLRDSFSAAKKPIPQAKRQTDNPDASTVCFCVLAVLQITVYAAVVFSLRDLSVSLGVVINSVR